MHQIASTIYKTGVLLVVCCLLYFCSSAQKKYLLNYRFVDTADVSSSLGLKNEFGSKELCHQFILELPLLMQKKGFVSASVDSFKIDSSAATVVIYLGKYWRWAIIKTTSVPVDLLRAVGFSEHLFNKQLHDFSTIQQLMEKMLSKLENTGYPFAKVYLDSFVVQSANIAALLKVDKGPAYKIDSIQIQGDVKISNRFLQRYLEIPDASLYQKQKLLNISSRLLQLPYLYETQKWNVTYLGTGAIINLYLKERKNSQINGLVGFLPTTDQAGHNKLLITGDFNLNLKNSFGLGESLLMQFQQIQVKSPRLQLGYQQPFLLGSPIGIDVGLDGLKKDSSFLNITIQLGIQYAFGGNRSAKLFYQRFTSTLLTVDTTTIRNAKQLPSQIDQATSNIGVEYDWHNTDYRFNPRKGLDVKFTGTVGIRKIKLNNAITGIKDPSNSNFNFKSLYDSAGLNAFTFRVKASIIKYIKTGKQTTFKLALNSGMAHSARIFRNELYQIGGFRMLRGFDEESIFASAYAVFTTEYRILTGLNSYIYAFADGGLVQNKSHYTNSNNQLLGTGFGLAFESKLGIFNIAFAAGKRNDLPFNLRQSKIHFGYDYITNNRLPTNRPCKRLQHS